MSDKEHGRSKSGVIRTGTSAKDVDVMSVSNLGLDMKSEGADEGNIVKMGTAAEDAEVLGRVVRTSHSAKWVKVRRTK